MLSYIDNKNKNNELVLYKINYDKDKFKDNLDNISDIKETINIMKYIYLSEKYDSSINPFNNESSLITDFFKGNINEKITKLKKIFAIKDDALFCYELESFSPLFARFYFYFYNLVELQEVGRYHMECINKTLDNNEYAYGGNNFTMNLRYIIYSAKINSEVIDIINKRDNFKFSKVKVKK